MEYTIKKLGMLAGVTTRTLRYYDEIGILKPARINSSGYRIYGQKEVDRLQQVLFYRELGLSLEYIREIVSSPLFDEKIALNEHLEKLLEKRKQLDDLIKNVEKTIAFKEGRINMNDKEKFEGFKEKLIEDNQKKYGEEARAKYGDDAVNKSNNQFKNMTEEQYAEFEKLTNSVLETLEKAYETKDPSGELAQKAADLHRQWITFCWGRYDKEAHRNLVQMYVDDERFTAYYDKKNSGTAAFLRDAVNVYTCKKM